MVNDDLYAVEKLCVVPRLWTILTEDDNFSIFKTWY
jgi:hypothetical protein